MAPSSSSDVCLSSLSCCKAMEHAKILHIGCVSSVFLASKQGPDQDHKVVKAYHKAQLQARHWLNITREVSHLRHLKELRVPGVVELCGTADDTTNVYLVFEPCFGGDLYKRLTRYGLLHEEQLCRQVVAPLLKVLQSLHKLGIIHRDLKPENVFFEADGSLRLGDFGLAIDSSKERPISRVGTLDYMAPEVLAQPSADAMAILKIKPNQLPSYDCKVDIWALGVLVYEAYTGRTPFSHTDPQAAALKAQFRPPLPLPASASAELQDFVAQALSKQAAKRPGALELLEHPWVQACMSDRWQDRGIMHGHALRSEFLRRTPSADPAAPDHTSGVAHPITSMNCTAGMDVAHSSTCSSSELNNSAQTTSSPLLSSVTSSTSTPQSCDTHAGQSPGLRPSAFADYRVQAAETTMQQKAQPSMTKPLPAPQHTGTTELCQLDTTGPLLRMLLPTHPEEAPMPADVACSKHAPGRTAPQAHMSTPLPIPELSMPSTASTAEQHKLSRQLSSPARLRDELLSQEQLVPQPALFGAGSSPPPSVRGGLSALALSPMRALLGAGRSLVRSRSGAAAPAADGSLLAPVPCKEAATAGSMSFTGRSPVPISPIRGLLQPTRRKPSHATSASLFAAAQWRPPPLGSRVAASSASMTITGTTGQHHSGVSLNATSGLPKCSNRSCSRTSSLGPSTSLEAAHSSEDSSVVMCDSGSSVGCSSSSANNAAAAVTPVAPDTRWLHTRPGRPGGSGDQCPAPARLHTQQLALLHRCPSAPDPHVLTLSPVNTQGRAPGMPSAPVDKGGMRGMWLKVQGVCRMVSKPCAREDAGAPHDGQCLVLRSP